MNRITRLAVMALLCPALAMPAYAQKLSKKDNARVARAAPEDQDAVAGCLRDKNKGRKTGTIVGGAGAAGGAIIAGGSVGETVVAGAAGALVGRAVGRGTGTSDACDDLLKRNK